METRPTEAEEKCHCNDTCVYISSSKTFSNKPPFSNNKSCRSVTNNYPSTPLSMTVTLSRVEVLSTLKCEVIISFA